MARLWGNIASMLGIGGQPPAIPVARAPNEAAPGDPIPLATTESTSAQAASPLGPERAAPQEAATRLEFGQRLSTLASFGGAISAGRVKLINLEALKREFGPRWDQIGERVAATISSTLKSRLGARDAFIRLDEAHFVVLFGTHDGERAAAVCSLIAAEIKQKLFGIERELSAIKLATATVSVEGGVTLDPIDPIATLSRMLDAAPAVTDHQLPTDADIRKPKSDPEWREYRRPRQPGEEDGPRSVPIRISPRALNDLIKTLGLAIGDWRQASAPAEHVIYDGAELQRQISESARRQETLRQIEAAASGMTVPVADPGSAASDGTERDLIVSQLRGANFRYQPIWHRETQAITSYGLNLRFLVGDAQLSVNELMSWEDDPEVVVAVDLLMARKALADLSGMMRQGAKAILSLPLHRAVLDMPVARAELLALLTAASVPMRQLILLDVLDAYAGDWALLPALVAGLRRVSREVVLRLPLDHTDFSRVRAAGARTVGGDLREHAWPHARAMRGLADFGKAAHSAGLRTYVLGINTAPLAIAAIAAGFDYLAGNAVSPEIPQPVGVVPLDAAQLSRGASDNRNLKR
jgi:EAL domain-containing protein (putative c-di-GMP-specific phosphodiesterase class I)/GGDEF domain-containing protein